MQKTTEKLIKTRVSLGKHISRGNRVNGTRSLQLVDKYNDLKQLAQKEGSWEAYCLKFGSCKTHDAYDFFA